MFITCISNVMFAKLYFARHLLCKKLPRLPATWHRCCHNVARLTNHPFFACILQFSKLRLLRLFLACHFDFALRKCVFEIVRSTTSSVAMPPGARQFASKPIDRKYGRETFKTSRERIPIRNVNLISSICNILRLEPRFYLSDVGTVFLSCRERVQCIDFVNRFAFSGERT